MSGPSLWQAASHRAVHEAQEAEAADGLAWLRSLVAVGDRAAEEVARALLEVWATRILAHAAAEEEDLYPWLRQARPHVSGVVEALAREHAALPAAVDQARTMLEARGPLKAVLTVLGPATDLLGRHARREEALLASPEAGVPSSPLRPPI